MEKQTNILQVPQGLLLHVYRHTVALSLPLCSVVLSRIVTYWARLAVMPKRSVTSRDHINANAPEGVGRPSSLEREKKVM